MFAFWLCVTYINSFESIVCKHFDRSIFYLPRYRIVDRFSFFWPSYVCPSSIYGFWLPLWPSYVCPSSIYGFWLPLSPSYVMRKRPNCDYDKRNIFLVSPSSSLVIFCCYFLMILSCQGDYDWLSIFIKNLF
jgi:hypothetical protein